MFLYLVKLYEKYVTSMKLINIMDMLSLPVTSEEYKTEILLSSLCYTAYILPIWKYTIFTSIIYVVRGNVNEPWNINMCGWVFSNPKTLFFSIVFWITSALWLCWVIMFKNNVCSFESFHLRIRFFCRIEIIGIRGINQI